MDGVAHEELFRKATEMMEKRLLLQMRKSIQLKNHFVLETPLSHPDYWTYINLFENSGYQIQLNYLCLDKVSNCIARVGQRVVEGGHFVEPRTIKGVYEKNLEYINEYKNTFKIIELYDGTNGPDLLARIEDNKVIFGVKQAISKDWIVLGLPSLAQSIKSFLQ